MFLPGGLIVQSLLGGAGFALDQNAGDNMGLDFITGTATAGAFGKFFDMAGRLIKNTGGKMFGDDGRRLASWASSSRLRLTSPTKRASRRCRHRGPATAGGSSSSPRWRRSHTVSPCATSREPGA